MIERLFKRLARIVYRYDLAVLASAAVICLISVVGVRKIEFISNAVYMLPSSIPAVNDYLEVIEREKSVDYLVVLFSGADQDDLSRFSDLFASELLKTELVSEVRYKITPEDIDYILGDYMKNIFLYLDDGDFGKVTGALAPEAVEKSVELDRRLLLSPDASSVARLIVADPLNLLSIVKDKLLLGVGGVTISNSFGHFFSKDGKYLIMLIRPSRNPSDLPSTDRLFARLGEIEKKVRSEPGLEGVTVEYTGNHAMVYWDLMTIKRDLKVTSLVALMLVFLLFYLAFRRVSVLLFTAVSLNAGVLWTTGFIGFALGHITTVTAIYAAILNGLGIDFSLHIYNRFLEEIRTTDDHERALERTFAHTGPAVFNGALTTIVTFFAMCFSRFRGLSELGLIGGVGLIMILVTSFTVLPAILIRYLKIRGGATHYRPLPSLGTEGVARFVVGHKRTIAIGSILLTIVMAVAASHIGFESDINRLKPKDNPALIVKERIQSIIGTNFFPVIVTARGDDLDRLLLLSERSGAILGSSPDVALVEGPSAYLPSRERQERNLERLSAVDLERTARALDESLVKNGFKPEKFRSFEETLSRFSTGKVPLVTYDDLAGTPVEGLINTYVQKEDDTWSVSILAYPRQGKWDNDIDPGVLRRLTEGAPEIRVASFSLIVAQMKESVIHDFYLTIILAALAVFVTILVLMRDIRAVFYCMTVLSMGVVWMLGMIGLLGLNMDFANITVTPMVIGLGIDYSVHIYYRYKEGKGEGIVAAIGHTGRAIVMTALTTTAGYASLFLAKYPPINSIGYLSVLGIGACLATTYVVLPAFLALGEKKDEKGA
jgi:predicted RND superfamily exporter protein